VNSSGAVLYKKLQLKMINNLFVLGSPRRNGNSETMANNVAASLLKNRENSVEYIHPCSLKISPCLSCGGCSNSGICILNDDMTDLYTKIDAAHRIFFVSPVYFYGLSAQIKSFIDRCQALWARKYLLGIKNNRAPGCTGHLLSCAATGGDKVFEGSILTIRCLCDTLGLHYSPPLLLKNIDEADALQNSSEKLGICKSYGKKVRPIL